MSIPPAPPRGALSIMMPPFSCTPAIAASMSSTRRAMCWMPWPFLAMYLPIGPSLFSVISTRSSSRVSPQGMNTVFTPCSEPVLHQCIPDRELRCRIFLDTSKSLQAIPTWSTQITLNFLILLKELIWWFYFKTLPTMSSTTEYGSISRPCSFLPRNQIHR